MPLCVTVLLGLSAPGAHAANEPLSSTGLVQPGSRTTPPDFAGLRPIESSVQDLIDDLAWATVAVQTGRRGGSTATGVFIDEDLVLTAGHVGSAPGRRVSVVMHDGERLSGRTLGQVYRGDVDVGLIRVDTDDDFEVSRIPFGNNEEIERGDWVILLGHDSVARQSVSRSPSARLGRVLRSTTNRLDVDAPFDAGDSGGPVFDLEGRLLGIVSRCGHQPWQNVATGIGAIREYIPLLEDVDRDMTTIELQESVFRHVRNTESSKRDPELLEDLEHLTWTVSPSIVQVLSGDRLVTHGTIVDDGLVLSKASLFAREIDDAGILTTDERRFEDVRAIAIDPDLDLVLLEVDGLEAPQLMWGEPPTEAGSIVLMPRMHGGVRSMGIICRDEDALEPNSESKPFIGIGYQPHNRPRGLRISSVVPSSAAAHAGLQVGDVLRRIDQYPAINREGMRRTLERYDIGDPVRLSIDRDGESLDIPIRLGLRPAVEIRWTPGNTSVGTNRHSTGYGRVLLTDADIHPHQVCVPAVDLDGRPIGLVLARRGRTTTVILPADRTLDAVRKLRAEEMEADIADRLAVYRIQPTESPRGELILTAEDGFPIGENLRRARLNEGRVTYGNWESMDDALEWQVRIDRPGRFRAEIIGACSGRSAGTPFQLSIGDTRLDGRVQSTGNWNDFEPMSVGEFEIEETGDFRVRLEPMATPRNVLMIFSNIRLVRLSDVAD